MPEGYQRIVDAVIANGQSLSGLIPLGNETLCGIQMPAAWTAADLSFQVSYDGTTWAEMIDQAGANIAVTGPAASEYVAFNNATIALFAGVRFLKIRSGPVGAPVAQGAARTLKCFARPFG
jgi:hypothetical protein